MTKSREYHLVSRPQGAPTLDNFGLVDVEIPTPSEGQMLVKNLYMSVDPYMRGRMRDVKSYIPPFQIGEVLSGGSVGEVIESRLEGFKPGDHVLGMEGWREFYLSDGKGQRKVDAKLAPLSAYLGVLGMPGMTAYVGLLDIGAPKEGETVFVSGAAGAVGSIVGQLAKLQGCRVVGSAGSEEKVRFLIDELGFDAAFNYKHGNLEAQLKEACPKGIDVYFDNVGGDMLEAVLVQMNPFGRIPVCGMISSYNSSEKPAGPSSLFMIIPKRLKLQGFIVSDHGDRMGAFFRDVAGWLKEEKLVYKETILEGIEKAPEAFVGLFKGENLGKMLVKL